jgi:hypothetical protein
MKKQVQIPVKVEKVVEQVTEMRTEVVEEEDGLITLLGKNVCLMCLNYFYFGKLVGVNSTCVKLENPEIIYETGEWKSASWKDAQKLPTKYNFVKVDAIESFFEVDKK